MSVNKKVKDKLEKADPQNSTGTTLRPPFEISDSAINASQEAIETFWDKIDQEACAHFISDNYQRHQRGLPLRRSLTDTDVKRAEMNVLGSSPREENRRSNIESNEKGISKPTTDYPEGSNKSKEVPVQEDTNIECKPFDEKQGALENNEWLSEEGCRCKFSPYHRQKIERNSSEDERKPRESISNETTDTKPRNDYTSQEDHSEG